MEHFPEETWVDFVRGTLSSAAALDMERHVAGGCAACKAALDFWQEVQIITRQESASTPPESAVRAAKLEFCFRQQSEPQEWTLASIVLDSFLEPAPAGLRSGTLPSRQVVYEGEGLTIDLRFDRQLRSTKVCVSGQVLDRQSAQAVVDQVAVALWTDKGKSVAVTEANEFGEFQLEFEPHDQLRLSIAMAGRRTLRIPLGSLV
jgi:hypothetical protein